MAEWLKSYFPGAQVCPLKLVTNDWDLSVIMKYRMFCPVSDLKKYFWARFCMKNAYKCIFFKWLDKFGNTFISTHMHPLNQSKNFQDFS